MKKKFYLFIFIIICFTLASPSVSAASASIKTSSNSITKGNKVTISYTVSSGSPIFSIEGSLKCSGAGVSGGIDLNYDDTSNSLYSKTYTYTVTTTSTGTLSCSATGVRVSDYNTGKWESVGDKYINVTVNAPYVAPPKEYSKNNYLKSLTIEGYEIAFNKDTTEYSIEVANDVQKVNIKAETEDSKAHVSGIGEISVTEGTNKLEVKVTAENGNEKIYIINVNVKELSPIDVNIGTKKYSVIRKEGILEEPKNYEKTTVNISSEEVLAYYNEKTKYTLVGLKDSEGNSAWYIYNQKDNTYSPYNSLTIGGISLVVITMPDDILPNNYYKTTFTSDNNKIEAYQYRNNNATYAADDNVKKSDFYLFYAINELTGEKSLYTYDKLENTIQRYNNELSILYNKKADNYFLYFLITLITLCITIITFTIILIKKKKHKPKLA